jgi:hypothetical protein
MYKNFIPTVWASQFETTRDQNLVAVSLSNRDYEGEIRDYGDTVKVCGAVRPTVSDYDPSSGLSDPENLPDLSSVILIDQRKTLNFQVGDIDARQARGDILSIEMDESSKAMAQAEDSFVYNKIYSEIGYTKDVASLTTATTLSTITGMLTALYEANVPTTELITLEVSPKFAEKMLLAGVLRNTDNVGMLTNGLLDSLKLFNVQCYVSTNIKNDGTYDYIVMRTKPAFAFASQLAQPEAYRPDKFFSDSIRVLNLFGGAVVRPQEIQVARVTYGVETGI